LPPAFVGVAALAGLITLVKVSAKQTAKIRVFITVMLISKNDLTRQ